MSSLPGESSGFLVLSSSAKDLTTNNEMSPAFKIFHKKLIE